MGKRPLDILHNALNQRVVVEMRAGRSFRGTLDGYDHPHMNLVLKDAEEVQNGNLVRKLSNVVVRGDGIVCILP